tara:strand:+ start:221 stop:868 length:648 start_codon:yes stop_codon:yes gene_type:complete
MDNIVNMNDGLAKSLNLIQTKLRVEKGHTNNFGRYDYRNLSDILEKLKPLLEETGTSVIITDTVECVNGFNYIKATVTLTDGNDSISSTGWARESVTKKGMDDSQITGATSSYARKYACNGLFAIDDTKDADAMDNREQTINGWFTPSQGHVTVEQWVKIDRLSRDAAFKGTGKSKKVIEFIKTNPTEPEVDKAIESLEKQIKAHTSGLKKKGVI